MNEIDKYKISRMVEAYFECTLSVKEDKELGRLLASLPPEDLLPDWEDALAQLSLAARARRWESIFNENAMSQEDRIFYENAMRPSEASRTRQMGRIFRKNAFLKIAASVAVIVAVAFFALRPSPQSEDCYAYVDGKLVTDRQDISRLMDQQLSDMAEAQSMMMASVEVDLSEMAEYMEEND